MANHLPREHHSRFPQATGCDSDEHHVFLQVPQGHRRDRTDRHHRPLRCRRRQQRRLLAPPPRPPTTKAAAPKPVAAIDNWLKGNDTQVTLDQGFVDALTSLKLTPGMVGKAKLTDGTLSFPITGGNVTVFKPGTIEPTSWPDPARGLRHLADRRRHQGRADRPQGRPGRLAVYGDVTVNGKVAATSAYMFKLEAAP